MPIVAPHTFQINERSTVLDCRAAFNLNWTLITQDGREVTDLCCPYCNVWFGSLEDPDPAVQAVSEPHDRAACRARQIRVETRQLSRGLTQSLAIYILHLRYPAGFIVRGGQPDPDCWIQGMRAGQDYPPCPDCAGRLIDDPNADPGLDPAGSTGLVCLDCNHYNEFLHCPRYPDWPPFVHRDRTAPTRNQAQPQPGVETCPNQAAA